MRTIVNLILHCLVLWVAWRLFPDIVQVDSLGTLVLVVVLLWLIALLVGVLCVLMLGASLVIGDINGLIVGAIIFFVMALFVDVIGLDFLSHYIPGFMVVGFWPKVILAFLLSVFTVGTSER